MLRPAGPGDRTIGRIRWTGSDSVWERRACLGPDRDRRVDQSAWENVAGLRCARVVETLGFDLGVRLVETRCYRCGDTVVGRFCSSCGAPTTGATGVGEASGRLCARCGARLTASICTACGAVEGAEDRAAAVTTARPALDDASQAAPTPTRPGWVTVALAALVVLIVGVGAGFLIWWLEGDQKHSATEQTGQPPRGRSPSGSTSPTESQTLGAVAACASSPILVPIETRTEGGMQMISFDVAAVCPGGQWLNSAAYEITATTSGDVIADGRFDFTSQPVWVPEDGGTTLHAFFRPESVWTLPSDLASGIAAGEVSAAGAITDQPQALTDEPVGGRTQGVEASADQIPISAAQQVEQDRYAEAALERLAAADRPHVTESIVGWWVPQISSKRPGIRDDGITYDYPEIYAQHVELRSKYPRARLLWSGEWASFELTDYWVTISGVPYPTGQAANRWCDRQALDWTQCFAKRIMTTGTPDGTTMSRS